MTQRGQIDVIETYTKLTNINSSSQIHVLFLLKTSLLLHEIMLGDIKDRLIYDVAYFIG
jgi:hypothetical protein